MRVGWIGGIRFGAGGAKIWARGILSPVHVSTYTARDVTCAMPRLYQGTSRVPGGSRDLPEMDTTSRRGGGLLRELMFMIVDASCLCRVTSCLANVWPPNVPYRVFGS